MSRRFILLAFGLVLFVASCSTPTPPPETTPDRLILFSTEVDPTRETTTKELFHGHVVLGKIEITDPEQRAEVWKAFREAIGDESKEKETKCFDPRHGLRVIHGSQEVDHHFCFMCMNRFEYRGWSKSREYGISRAPKELLNRILIQANIPIAPERGKE